jgi:serine/threonine protein kinase
MAADERHPKAKEIFHEALLLDDGERASYLELACVGDQSLRQEVDRMLTSDRQTGNFWEEAIQNQNAERLTAAYGADDANSPIGAVLKNRYLIQSLLGEGGIGTVYRAVDLQINSRPVAVKLLREDRYKSKDQKTDEWLKRKFLQEAEALSRVRHPGVVMVLDKGELGDGRPFFVMEWVEGRSLRDAMKPYGMDFEQAALVVQQMGQALTAVHNQQVFHRDLKPENVMLQNLGDGEEQAKLIDFGIAKVKDSELGPETSTAMVVGTLPYLAPEQIQGQTTTAATDTYALGVIAYEMLTGRWPFNPTSNDPHVAIQQISSLQQAGQFLKAGDLRSDLPEAAENAIVRALSFDPAARHARTKDFGEDLAQALLDRKEANQEDKRGSRQSSDEMKPEPAHVLFMDIVEYSKRPMSQQRQIVNHLQDIVRNAGTVKQARDAHQVIILFTGDGMALGFFGEPLLSLECAKEIGKAMQSQHDFELRMGLHTGPVYRIEDINANKNIAGGGINLAQRVMDCGDARHILFSKTYADYLIQLGDWTQYLSDLGECEVKHGLKLHLYNFFNGDVGNPETPSKLRTAQPDVNIQTERSSQWRIAAITTTILVVIAIAVVWRFGLSSEPASPPANVNRSGGEFKPEPVRTLNYSVLVQTWRGNKPVGEAQEMFGDLDSAIYFREDDRIRLNITAAQAGYLYLLNEGPKPASDERPVYTVMFPSLRDNDASALVAANRRKTVPRTEDPPIGFVGNKGTERVWLVWSVTPIAELEAVKRLNNPKDFGAIRDANQVSSIQIFLTLHSGAKIRGEKDEAELRTKLSFSGDLLVHLVRLEHR